VMMMKVSKCIDVVLSSYTNYILIIRCTAATAT
jgi:hypothetical protein